MIIYRRNIYKAETLTQILLHNYTDGWQNYPNKEIAIDIFSLNHTTLRPTDYAYLEQFTSKNYVIQIMTV